MPPSPRRRRPPRPTRLAAATGLLVSLATAEVLTPAPAATSAAAGPTVTAGDSLARERGPSPRASRWAYDTTSRAAVEQAYRRDLAPLLREEAPVVPDGCSVPATPADAQRRTIGAVNVARRLAGLDPVRLDADLSRRAQRAALIMHFHGALTHAPERSLRCWSAVGAAAAGASNLARGYAGADSVRAYLDDPGSANRVVGHRRWLLAPTTEAMGTGQVGDNHAMYVVPPARHRSDRNADPLWIRWPSAGWFPAELEPAGRWSFGSTRPGLDLGRATVRVSTGGRDLALRRWRPVPGYGGQSALVWDLRERLTVPEDGVRTVVVTVRGLRSQGRALPPVRYAVRLFHAAAD